MPTNSPTLAAVRDLATTESDFQTLVVEYAVLRGWLVYHPWSSLHSAKGWPDLAMVRGGRLVLAELKTERGKVSPAQQAWLDALGECAGVEVVLWRPSQWATIEAMLR